MIIALTDFETTGLNPDFHEIIEIGCVFFDSTNGIILDTFEAKIKPEHPERFDSKALQVNGYNEAEWMNAHPLDVVLRHFGHRLMKSHFASWNLTFDYGFLKAGFDKTKMPWGMARPSIDIISVAFAKTPPKKIVLSWSLKATCERLGIAPEPEQHRALNGAMAAYHVYKEVMGL